MKIIANKDKLYKCDQCDSTLARKSEAPIHINEKHKKCIICEHIFTNTKVLQTHMKAVHKKSTRNLKPYNKIPHTGDKESLDRCR